MTEQLLFYKDVQPINRERHKNLYLEPLKDFSFSKGVNSVPLMALEFINAAAEYTIVFSGDEQAVIPAVILGVTQDSNAYFDESDKWTAHYIPAFVRRYPFICADTSPSENLTLCIDESFTGFNQNGRGERLFEDDGSNTHYLKGILGFMEDYQQQFDVTKRFCKKLITLNLLEPMTARYKDDEGSERVLKGFWGVKREVLKALPVDTITELFKTDELELIYLHINSTRNFRRVAPK